MTPTVQKIIDEITQKAKEGGLKSVKRRLASGSSSLHRIIKTPAQAKRLMQLMEASKQASK